MTVQDQNGMPARMGKLSVLPVFFGLEGERVLVAGGSEAAAWKAGLLLAADARVDLFAESLSENMAAIVWPSLPWRRSTRRKPSPSPCAPPVYQQMSSTNWNSVLSNSALSSIAHPLL